MKILFLTLILTSASVLSAENSKINNNNSFEKVSGNMPAGWIKNSYYIQKGVFGFVEIVQREAKDGNNALEILTDAKQTVHLFTNSYFKVSLESLIKMSIFAKGKGSMRIALYAYDTKGKMLGVLYPKISEIDAKNWKEFKFQIKNKKIKGKEVAKVRPAILVYSNCSLQLDKFSGEIVNP